jgi:hypothetical protein
MFLGCFAATWMHSDGMIHKALIHRIVNPTSGTGLYQIDDPPCAFSSLLGKMLSFQSTF